LLAFVVEVDVMVKVALVDEYKQVDPQVDPRKVIIDGLLVGAYRSVLEVV
jgi:hypothetical protein